MGDEGRLYVHEHVPKAYRSILRNADLIVPNCFEAELLSDVEITDMESLVHAVTVLHNYYQLPHVIITSVRLKDLDRTQSDQKRSKDELSVIGSSCTAGTCCFHSLTNHVVF